MSKPDGQLSVSANAPPRLTTAEFARISRFAYERFGLDLRAGKEELVAARLSKKIRQGGFNSFGDYLEAAIGDKTGDELGAMIHALTTHHTSFYREMQHFELLESLVKTEFARLAQLRIWSSACSTGEEPFSIAGCVAAIRPNRMSWEVLATDVSSDVLETGRRGLYSEQAVTSLPSAWQKACFQKGHGKSAGWFRVRPEIQERVCFETFNLVDQSPIHGKWHVIFCRNVMIYFDKPTQDRVIQRLSASLEPGGYLLVGHSESLTAASHGLEYVCPATYRKAKNSRIGGSGA